MNVSHREEALAQELYAHDMGRHQGEFVKWDEQIERVKDSYRRQASKVVNTKWFRYQLNEASVMGAYREAIARDEADSDNRLS